MKRLIPLILILIIVAIAGSIVLAQHGEFVIGRFTFGSSGTSSKAGYTIHGTAGQAAASPVMSGGRFAASGGFWSGITARPPGGKGGIYLPLVTK